jgi:UDPglucose--hexose-1-phosphate uridylyltransferase
MTGNEIRFDPIRNRHVIIAPRRAKRGGFTDACPFCPEARRGKKVMPNAYPIVSPKDRRAYGHHALIIDTPKHDEHFEDLSIAKLAGLIKIYAEATAKMENDRRVKYVLVAKNSGRTAGASKPHAHTQVMAFDFLSPMLKDESFRAFWHRQRHQGRCWACQEDASEVKGPRLIYRDRHAIAFAPAASAFPFEAAIRTRRHIDNLTQMTAGERRSVAAALKRVVATLKGLGIEYNFVIHDIVDDADQHLTLQIFPRRGTWGGLEFDSGVTVNAVPPETAASQYRRYRLR